MEFIRRKKCLVLYEFGGGVMNTRIFQTAGLTAVLLAGAVVSASSSQTVKSYQMAQASCPYYVVLGCFKSDQQANQRFRNIGARVIDSNQVSGFKNGFYCVVDGPHNSRSYANTLRQSWLGTVGDAYVKKGCELSNNSSQPTPPPPHPAPPPVVRKAPAPMEVISYNLAADQTDQAHPNNVPEFLPGLWTSGMTAALNWGNGKVQIFRGNEYIRYDLASRSADPGYPKPVNNNSWPGLWTSGIDAAYNNGNGKAYFFRNVEYIRYDIAKGRVDPGYPKPVNEKNWPGLFDLGPIDSAVNAGNGKVYFFSGGRYLRYDIAKDRTDSGYPKQISANNWPGVWDYNVKMAVGAPHGRLLLFHSR